MRLALASDLHVDTWSKGQKFAWHAAPAADVLLLAGDMHDDQDGTAAVLRKAAQRYPLVVWVDGNHEAYKYGADLSASARDAAALCLPDNIVFLGARRTLLRDGVLFVGACAWWDFQFCQPEREPEDARQRFRKTAQDDGWFDAKPADGRSIDQVVDELAAADAAHVASAVTAAQADAAVRAIVVLTHTVPHRSLLRKGVYPRSLLDAAYYGSSLMEAIPALDGARKLALWGFGHSHAGADAMIDHVRYLSHPRGRPDDFNRVSYQPLLLELEGGGGGAPPRVTVVAAGDDMRRAAPAEAAG